MVKYWLSKNPDLTQIDLEGQSFIDILNKQALYNIKELLEIEMEKRSLK